MNLHIIKSQNDNYKYKYIKLTNDLEIILITDPNNKLPFSSVALSVKVGYYDEYFQSIIENKKEILNSGIAHLIEHMLFMGSEKYPDENLFHNYISNNGGITNAFTSGDHTCYHYTIQQDSDILKKSLDIFAHFFIDPLLNKEAIEREINAVNSEHEKNMTSDLWRKLQIIKECARKNNPFSYFSTGTKLTLHISDIDIIIKKFYEKTYSADKMKLVIMTNEQNIQINTQLEIDIKYIFSQIKKITYSCYDNNKMDIEPLYNKRLIKMIPINSDYNMDIIWQIYYIDKKNYYKFKPIEFIIYLLNNDGPGSLNEYLKIKNWINSLSCSLLDYVGNYAIIITNINLTWEGFQEKKIIYNLLYEYINVIKNNDIKKIYDNQKIINQKIFDVQEINDLSQYVINIASDMLYNNIPLQYIISHKYLLGDFDNIEFNKIINEFNENNSVIVVSSKYYQNTTNKIEKYYNINYSSYKFESFLNNKYNNHNKYIKFLPKKNPFITSNINKLLNIETMKEPILIDNDNIQNFYKSNTVFKIPLVVMHSMITFPKIKQNVETNLSFLIFFEYVNFLFSSYLYQILETGYDININFNNDNILFYIYGPNEKINSIINLYIYYLNYYREHLDNKIIKIIKDKIKINLINMYYLQPFIKIEIIIRKYMEDHYYDYNDMLNIIDKLEITKDKLDNIFDEIKIQCLFEGNLNKLDAFQYGLLFKKINSKYKKFIYHDEIIKKYVPLYNYITNENKLEKNNIIVYSYNFGYLKASSYNDLINMVFLMIFEKCINKKFFEKLRTKYQLGYIVKSFISKIGNINYPYYQYRFVVQSLFKIDKLSTYIDDFINNYTLKINNKEKELLDEFEICKKSIKEILSKDDISLEMNAARDFEYIIEMNHNFDIKYKILSIIDIFSFNDYIKIYLNFINIKNLIKFGIII